jgi:peptide/nickel transport system ATP-binding protein
VNAVGSGREPPILAARDIAVTFRLQRPSLFGPRPILRAVDGVSLEIGRGETVGLVGESGSGKSTTGRAVLRMEPLARGSIVFDGTDITTLGKRELRALRRRMQMIFQDPYSSLDPSMVVADSVAEPLEVHEDLSRQARNERVEEAFRRVHLSQHHMQRYPYEFSGGQRQRLAIARAIILEPDLIVADEAVSALDVSTQSQIINLLRELQAKLGIAYLFIAHDLALVRRVSQRIAVMYLGKLVELGPAERVYNQPAHPYTAALLSAIPYPHPRIQRQRERVVLEGDLPSPTAPPPGCHFHTRCPWAMEICRSVEPPTTPVDGGGSVACHLQSEGPKLEGRPLPSATPARTGRLVKHV